MYRENIYDVIESTREIITTLIVPKNSGLKGYAWKVLKEAGLNLDDAEEVAENKLRVGDLNIILKRGEDIPQLVMDYATSLNQVVLGLTGDDLYDEFRFRVPQNPLRIENTYDWFDEDARYLRPTLCYINRTGSIDDVPLEARVALNSKYNYTGRDFLRKSPLTRERKFDVTIYNGDVEMTVAEGTNDCCIDTVYSGKTIDKNGLLVIDIIRFSDLVVISPLGGNRR